MKTGLATSRVALATLVALTLQPVPSSAASVLGLNVNPATQGQFPEYFMVTNGVYGWTFELARPITVTGLAWFDQNVDGLSHPHEIGIWEDNYTGALVTSAIVPAGTNAQLVGGVWRTVDLGSPVSLPAGYYTIGGTYYTQTPDVVMFTTGPWLSDSRIQVGGAVFSSMLNVPPDPLFQEPKAGIAVNSSAELGPNLLVLPELPTLQLVVLDKLSVLSWPTWASNYVAEEAESFGTNMTWTVLTNAARVLNGSIVQTNSVGSAESFYRLRKL